MKLGWATLILSLAPGLAAGAGLELSEQPVDLLFEEGNVVRLRTARGVPQITGEDLPLATGPLFEAGDGVPTGNVADPLNQFMGGVKMDLTPRLSFAIIGDQPYGARIDYPTAETGVTVVAIPGIGTIPVIAFDDDASNNLGGTRALVQSAAVTGLVRYRLMDRIAVHGGLRVQRIEADVDLGGLAYGIPGLGEAIGGYSVRFDRSWGLGTVIGASYEIPEIAFRAALTYGSQIRHESAYRETIGASTNEGTIALDTPRSLTLDLESGIAADTLLFGRVRWAEHGTTRVSPQIFDDRVDTDAEGTSLTDLRDGAVYTLGVGRQITDRIAGSIALGYEPEGSDDVSAFAPVNGQRSAAIGLAYDATDRLTLSGGIQRIWFGDAGAETGPPFAERTSFSGNDGLAGALQVDLRF